MAEPISHKLIVRDDGEWFIVSGNPSIGYTCTHVLERYQVGHFKRSWQAVDAANDHGEVDS